MGSKDGRLQVVLDLDNTLIHSRKKEPIAGDPQSFMIRDYTNIINEGNYETIHVYKRPHLDYFLGELSKTADVHIFTASSRNYAE